MPEDIANEKSILVQVMAWINVDSVLSQHMASLGHTEVFRILMHNRDIETLIASTRAFFDTLYEWCLWTNLTINKDKTKFILFHTKNPVPLDLETLDTGVMSSQRVKSFNQLGVFIDDN